MSQILDTAARGPINETVAFIERKIMHLTALRDQVIALITPPMDAVCLRDEQPPEPKAESGKAGKRKATKKSGSRKAESGNPAGSVSEEYRKMMHPELAQPTKAEGRKGHYSPEAIQIIDAMRHINQPFNAADIGRATGIEADFPNHICRALVRGWLAKVSRGTYERTDKFPPQEKPAESSQA